MNFLHEGFLKLSSDRHTQTDTTEIIYHTAYRNRGWSNSSESLRQSDEDISV